MNTNIYTYKLGQIWLRKIDTGDKGRQGEEVGKGRMCAENNKSLRQLD